MIDDGICGIALLLYHHLHPGSSDRIAMRFNQNSLPGFLQGKGRISMTYDPPHIGFSPEPPSFRFTQSLPDKLRSSIRRRRLQLSAAQQRHHASLVSNKLSRHRHFQKASRIALYLSVNGELDPSPIVDICRHSSKQLYLPVLHPFRHGRLFFCEWRAHAQLQPNRFGILEPGCRGNGRIPLRSLDLILVPLVAFDARGQRIGMGGGFYDRTLGNARINSRWRRPRLIGIAHEMQRVPAITTQPWDVQLDAVVTEAGVYQGSFRY